MMMINAVFPAINRSGNSIIRSAKRVDERIETQISVIYGTGELDSTGTWQDTDSDTYFDVWVWAKNVGSSRILGIERTDLFFGKEGDYARIPHVNDAGGGYPSWSYTIENGTDWVNSKTVKFTIHYTAALTSDTYRATIVVPSGSSDEHYFSF